MNHRYFEFSVKLPQDYYGYENPVRDRIRESFSRGKITVTVTRNGDEDAIEPELDEQAVRRYLQSLNQLKKKLKLSGDIQVKDLAAFPRLLTFKKNKESTEVGWLRIQKLLDQAIAQAERMRQREGREMARDISLRLKHLRQAVIRIEALRKGETQSVFEKLQKRVSEVLGGEISDPDRLWREVALLVDRSDITEEITRFKSHLDLFETRLRSDQEVGRELDFLCQEMHREINTMGSKSQLFDISREVVFAKGEIEKIREQVQNVE